METFSDYLAAISDQDHRDRMEEVLLWVRTAFPSLKPVIAWNQPMFTDHGTFIIGFSVSKNHLAAAPERAAILHFSDAIRKAGFSQTKELIRFPWDRPIDYSLLQEIIAFNIVDKAGCDTFWRKA
jgi:hypothetical protein